MIKRDAIQHYMLHMNDDDQGGKDPVEKEALEVVRASVSINATYNEIAAFGVKTETVLHTTTDKQLDESVYSRYMYGNKLYRIMRQIKRGNEWFCVMIETAE